MKTKKGKEIKSDEDEVGVKFWTGKASLKRHWSKDKKKVRASHANIWGRESQARKEQMQSPEACRGSRISTCWCGSKTENSQKSERFLFLKYLAFYLSKIGKCWGV